MNEAHALRVVVVDDSDVVRLKLRQLLVGPSFEVVGEAPDGASGLQVIAKADPDVVVMDLQMPGMSGIDATWRLGGVSPGTRVLMLTVSDSEDDVADAVMAGAKGYVLKGSTDTEIANAVRQVAAGQSVISPAVAGVLVRRGTEHEAMPTSAVPDLPAARSSAPPASEEGNPPSPDSGPAPLDAGAGGLEPAVVSPAGRREVPRPLTVAVVLIAGFALTALGQGAAITGGDASSGILLRIALNFVIAYAVWHGGVLAAGRRAPFGWGRDRREDMDRAPVFE